MNTEEKKKPSQAFVEGFIKTLQTTQNPEDRNLLNSTFFGNIFPDIKSILKIIWLDGWTNL